MSPLHEIEVVEYILLDDFFCEASSARLRSGVFKMPLSGWGGTDIARGGTDVARPPRWATLFSGVRTVAHGFIGGVRLPRILTGVQVDLSGSLGLVGVTGVEARSASSCLRRSDMDCQPAGLLKTAPVPCSMLRGGESS